MELVNPLTLLRRIRISAVVVFLFCSATCTLRARLRIILKQNGVAVCDSKRATGRVLGG
jgi:hypothetical protein